MYNMYIIQYKLYCNLLRCILIPNATMRNVIACVKKLQRNKPDFILWRVYKIVTFLQKSERLIYASFERRP